MGQHVRRPGRCNVDEGADKLAGVLSVASRTFSACSRKERLTARQNDHTATLFKIRSAKECICAANAAAPSQIRQYQFDAMTRPASIQAASDPALMCSHRGMFPTSAAGRVIVVVPPSKPSALPCGWRALSAPRVCRRPDHLVTCSPHRCVTRALAVQRHGSRVWPA
jgi:hypothetical protein